jgi:hypothetical protein
MASQKIFLILTLLISFCNFGIADENLKNNKTCNGLFSKIVHQDQTSIKEVSKTLEENSNKLTILNDSENNARPNSSINLLTEDFYDNKSVIIGVSNNPQHYYLVVGKHRFDAFPDRGASTHTSNNIMAVEKGIFFKLNLPEEYVDKVIASMKANTGKTHLTCIHGVCKVLADADIIIDGVSLDYSFRIKPVLNGIISGNIKMGSEKIDNNAIKMYATSKNDLLKFFENLEKIEKEYSFYIAANKILSKLNFSNKYIMTFFLANGYVGYKIYEVHKEDKKPKNI